MRCCWRVLWLKPTWRRSVAKLLGLPSLSAAKTRSSNGSISGFIKQNQTFNHFRGKAARVCRRLMVIGGWFFMALVEWLGVICVGVISRRGIKLRRRGMLSQARLGMMGNKPIGWRMSRILLLYRLFRIQKLCSCNRGRVRSSCHELPSYVIHWMYIVNGYISIFVISNL